MLTARHSLLHALFFAAVMATAGCVDPGEPGEPGESIEQSSDPAEEFGLPSGKSDSPPCDQTSALCWSVAEQQAMRRMLALEDDLLRAETLESDAADGYLEQVDEFRHKLNEEEGDALDALFGDRSHQGPDELVREVRSRVVHRVALGYLAAHAVPLGRSSEGSGKADETEETAAAWSEELTPAMQESLQILHEQGPFGALYAFLFEHTGVLSRTYAPASEDWRSQPPVTLRAEGIVNDGQWAQARSSTISNLESLIPVAGIVISIPHGMLMSFRVRARMVLELAATYGLDVREDHNLLLAAVALMSVNELPEIRALMGASFAVPMLTKYAGAALGVPNVHDVLRVAIVRVLDYVWPTVGRLGRRILERAGAEAVVRGAGQQVASYATFGVAMLAQITFDVLSMGRAGAHVEAVMHPWGSNMLIDHTDLLLTPAGRDCATAFLADAANADGAWGVLERSLLTAHLGRHVWEDGRWRPLNSGEELSRQAMLAVEHQPSGEVPACVEESFVGSDERDRMTLLSWYRTVLAVDGVITADEQAGYEELVQALSGARWFGDGGELDERDLDAMESRVDAVFVGPELILGEDVVPAEGVDARRLITRFDEDYPRADAAFDCALSGGC